MKQRILVLSSQAFSLLHFRLDMMKTFQEKGYEVHAAAPECDIQWSERLSDAGITYHSIELERTGENPLKDIKALYSIRTLMQRIKPDIVFAYQAKTVIYGVLAARSLGIKRVYALVAGLGSAFRSREKTIGRCLVKGILSLEYKIALRYAKVVFFQNKDDSSEFVHRRLVKEKKIRYMNGSGVNTEHFSYYQLPEKKSFLFVGRLIKDKGILEFLNAATIIKKEYPNALFGCIGYFDSNPTALSEKDLQWYIDEGIITFLGKKDDVKPYLNQCYCFVLPSYHEGTPKSVLEAMAVGRPIITTDVPGCRETVQDGVNGYLVKVYDIDSLTHAMREILENDEKAKQMGRASRTIVEQKYDVRLVNQQLCIDMGL